MPILFLICSLLSLALFTPIMLLQEVLRWIRNVVKEFGTPNISTEQLSDYIHKTLNSGQVMLLFEAFDAFFFCFFCLCFLDQF